MRGNGFVISHFRKRNRTGGKRPPPGTPGDTGLNKRPQTWGSRQPTRDQRPRRDRNGCDQNAPARPVTRAPPLNDEPTQDTCVGVHGGTKSVQTAHTPTLPSHTPANRTVWTGAANTSRWVLRTSSLLSSPNARATSINPAVARGARASKETRGELAGGASSSEARGH